MNKKIILIIIGLIVIAGALAMWQITSQESVSKIFLSPQEKPNNNHTDEVVVGYGSSTQPDTAQAVNQALSSALKNFDQENIDPEYAIVYYTINHKPEKIRQNIANLLPNIQIHGGSSMAGVFTREGFHRSENGSLAIMLINSPKITFGVGGADVDKLGSAVLAGKKAIQNALKKAKASPENAPKMIYMMGSFNNEEDLIKGIEQVVGSDVPIVGGSSFDEDGVGKWSQIANKETYNNGVALTVFYTDLKIGWSYKAGYKKTKYHGTITKAQDRTIYEIDHRPALQVYNQWTDGLVDRVKSEYNPLPDTITEIQRTALYPFAKILTSEHGKTNYITMHPYLWNLQDESITLGVKVSPNDEISVVHGSWEMNLNHCQSAPQQALNSQNIKPGQGYFAIYNYCLGKLLTIPTEEQDKIPLLVNSALGNIPFIGANTGGEQGFIEGLGNYHGGLINDIIVFGPNN